MYCDIDLEVDGMKFTIDDGGLYHSGIRICFRQEDLLSITPSKLTIVKKFIMENIKEILVLSTAQGTMWDAQFLSDDMLLLILNGKVSSDSDKINAKRILDTPCSYRGYRETIGANNKKTHRKQSGYVYLLSSDNGLYKIGKTTTLDERVTNVTVKVPMRIELVHSLESDDYTWAEKELHARYADKRDHGEWFRLTPDDVEEIKVISSMNNTESGE